MQILHRVLIFLIVLFSLQASQSLAQKPSKSKNKLPKFSDYPAANNWRGPIPRLKLKTTSERMFRTQLLNASKQASDFAGHYRFAGWGCGSVCGAGAIVDLRTGDVYPPPLGGKGERWNRWMDCTALFDPKPYDYRRNSRLMIVRCGHNFDKKGKNWPDIYYFLWQGKKFKQLLHIIPPKF